MEIESFLVLEHLQQRPWESWDQHPHQRAAPELVEEPTFILTLCPLLKKLGLRTAVTNVFGRRQGLKGRWKMVMHWETWELRVDQHLNSIPGSFPNNHTTLNMSLVLSMPSFVFCEIGLSLFFFWWLFLLWRLQVIKLLLYHGIKWQFCPWIFTLPAIRALPILF